MSAANNNKENQNEGEFKRQPGQLGNQGNQGNQFKRQPFKRQPGQPPFLILRFLFIPAIKDNTIYLLIE